MLWAVRLNFGLSRFNLEESWPQFWGGLDQKCDVFGQLWGVLDPVGLLSARLVMDGSTNSGSLSTQFGSLGPNRDGLAH